MSENEKSKESFFKKRNYQLLLLGILFVTIGFILMAGGESPNPNKFNKEIFSFQRIRLAPTFILIGFSLEIYAIFWGKNKTIQ